MFFCYHLKTGQTTTSKKYQGSDHYKCVKIDPKVAHTFGQTFTREPGGGMSQFCMKHLRLCV